MGHRILSAFLVTLTAVTLAGFYMTLTDISNLRGEIETLKIISGKSDGANATGTAAILASTGENNGENEAPKKEVIVPAAIFFTALSSPRLQPQAYLSLIVESVSKDSDGDVRVSFKVSANEAASYSALEVRDIFELVDLETSNQRPINVSGEFDSMPPRSITTGSLDFRVAPDTETIIIQTRAENDISHYEFNFKARSYKKIILG